MNGLDFAAALVGHLVWPTVVVTALVLLRKPVSARLENLRAVRAGSFGAEFGEAERQVEQALVVEANRAEEAPAALGEPHDDELDDLAGGFKEIAQRASENPSYAVVASWALLEQLMSNVAADLQPTDRRARVSSSRAADVLLEQRVVFDETHRAITSLRRLRNEVAHGSSAPEAGEALAYVRAVDAVTKLIHGLLNIRSRG